MPYQSTVFGSAKFCNAAPAQDLAKLRQNTIPGSTGFISLKYGYFCAVQIKLPSSFEKQYQFIDH